MKETGLIAVTLIICGDLFWGGTQLPNAVSIFRGITK
jgi:hypothetical protein